MNVPYPVDCPNCGSGLRAHVGPPDHAPWVCDNCRRGWWPVELRPEVRKHWRADLESFPRHVGDVHRAIRQAALDAHARGVNVDESMLRVPGVAEKVRARGKRVNPAFAALVGGQ